MAVTVRCSGERETIGRHPEHSGGCGAAEPRAEGKSGVSEGKIGQIGPLRGKNREKTRFSEGKRRFPYLQPRVAVVLFVTVVSAGPEARRVLTHTGRHAMAAKKKTAAKKSAKKSARRPAARKSAKKSTRKAAKKRTPSAAFMKAMQPDSALGAVVGNSPIPRTEVVKKVWAYIRRNGLQDSRNKRNVNADEKLRAVFGKSTVNMFEMMKLINKHLS
jgi:upstream activation factor subunit UAF30